MKKTVNFLLALAMCCGVLCGCEGDNRAEPSAESASEPEVSSASEVVSDDPTQYTYHVTPMGGVSSCIYYGPNDYVPNSPDPEAARNKIHIWTICPTCGGAGDAMNFMIPVKDLDFSQGDTIVYTDSTSCFDCQTRRGIPQFMWSISITREKIEE